MISLDIKHEHYKVKHSQPHLACISLLWLGFQMFTSCSVLILLPALSNNITYNLKATILGTIVSVGASVGIVASPIFGTISDRYEGRFVNSLGKRIPFVILGVIGISGSLVLMAGLSAYNLFPLLLTSWILVNFFSSLTTAPYSAIIPDLVLREQFGSASGWTGFMTLAGNVIGASMGFFFDFGGLLYTIFIIVGCLIVCMIITSVIARGNPYAYKSVPVDNNTSIGENIKEFFVNLKKPFKVRDFTWLFWSRVLMGMGFNSIQQFIQYFIRDVLPAPYTFYISSWSITYDNEREATALFTVILLVSAVLSSLISGWLSDKCGRKIIVYFSGTLQAIAVGMAIPPMMHSFEWIVIVGILFGIGYGAFVSVDWALATDTLPSTKDFAKDMGIWQFAWGIPQIVAPLLSGVFLDTFRPIGASIQYPELGYTIIFGLSIIYFLGSIILIRNIKFEIRKQGQALDAFFEEEEMKKYSVAELEGREALRAIGADMDDDDDEYVVQESSDGSGTDSNKALDDFVGGKLEVDEISFDSDYSDEE